MYKIFIAGITAISLTFSTAAPAQANGFSEEDIGKFVFGLIAAAVAANLIKNNQNHEEPAPVAAPRPLQLLTPFTPHIPEPRPNRVFDWQPSSTQTAKTLPRTCLKRIDTRFGNYRIFQRNCMRNNYRFINSLPNTCKVRVVSDKGPRNGWDPQCLRQAGYRAGRH